MAVCHEYVQSENLFSGHFSRRSPTTIGLGNDWSSRPPIFLAEQFQIHLVDEWCILTRCHPTLQRTLPLRSCGPEDVNPDPSQVPPDPARPAPCPTFCGSPRTFGSLCWALPCLFLNMQLASIRSRP